MLVEYVDFSQAPMKFLFAMFQGGGNIPLIVPIAAKLVERGHAVRVIAGPGIRASRLPVSEGFRKRLVDAGVEIVAFQEPAVHPFDSLPYERGLIAGWKPGCLRREFAEARNAVWSPVWAANVSAQISTSRPDALVADMFLKGALAAGEAASVPTAVLFHNIPPPRAAGMPPRSQGFQPARNAIERTRYMAWRWAIERVFVRNGLDPLNAARSELGLSPLRNPDEQYAHADRVLMLVSQHFDFPARLPPNVRYVGTPIDDTTSSGQWQSPWPAEDSRPLLLVSLSTLSQGQGPTMTRILDAVESLPLRVLVTLGPSLRKEDFQAPPNAILETFIPHSAVLPHVSAVVTQCGLGTLMKTLINGIPVVCLPLAGDQPDNAARVVVKGAGLRLPSDASAGEIRTAIRLVIEERRYREAAQAWARELAGLDAAEAAAIELESMISTKSGISD